MDQPDEKKRGEFNVRSNDKMMLAMLIFSWCGVSAQEVITIAGRGPSIAGHADGTSTSATFRGPLGATLGSNGTLLIVVSRLVSFTLQEEASRIFVMYLCRWRCKIFNRV